MVIAVRAKLDASDFAKSATAWDVFRASNHIPALGLMSFPIVPETGKAYGDAELFFDHPPVEEMTIGAWRARPDRIPARIVDDGQPRFLLLADPDETLRPFMTRGLEPERGGYRYFEHDEVGAFPDEAKEAIASALADAGIAPAGSRDIDVVRAAQDHLLGAGSRAFADVFSAMSGYRVVRHVGTNMSGHEVDRWICVCENTSRQDAQYVDATGHDGWIGFAGSIGKAPAVADVAGAASVDLDGDPEARLALAWIDHAPMIFAFDWIRTLRERAFGPATPEAAPGRTV